MNVLCVLIGMIIGFFLALFGQVAVDRNSVEKGFVKLCGEYYRLKKISQEKNNED